MALQSKPVLESKLFTSDPQSRVALQACLVSDQAHIQQAAPGTPATRGPHVAKIQEAIFQLGNNVAIDPGELQRSEYGPSTAAAVLAYKKNRGIINPSYQNQADPIVGKHTIAQLDNEMLALEGKLVPPKPTSVLLTVGTISWIQGSPSPISGAGTEAAEFSPTWIPPTYLGLAATSNPAPPFRLDVKEFRSARQFRAMTFCRFSIDIDEADHVSNFKVLDAFHDPGFTPPFQKAKFPAAVVDAILHADSTIFDSSFAPGEASVNSLVSTQGRHANTTIKDVPTNEVVLVNSLIKFRAGKHTDDIGVNKIKADFHVPWVWCEMVVTFLGRNTFKIYGRGSLFPSHSWYFDSVQIGSVGEIGDSRFPILRGTRSLIETSRLKLFPVLSKGARTPGPQAADARFKGSVEDHPNTAAGGREITVTRSIAIERAASAAR
jgi:hypothetical protein